MQVKSLSQQERQGLSWLPDYQTIVACQKKEESGLGQNLLPPESLARDEKCYWKDYEYMLGLLSGTARECWAASDAVLDRYEYEGSAIYMEYPDQIALSKIADLVYEAVSHYEKEGGPDIKDLVYAMTYWNISFRRQRFYRREKVFYS